MMNFVLRLGVSNIASFHLSILLKSLSFSTNSSFRKWYTPGFGASQDQACASSLEFWSYKITWKPPWIFLAVAMQKKQCIKQELNMRSSWRKSREESRLASCRGWWGEKPQNGVPTGGWMVGLHHGPWNLCSWVAEPSAASSLAVATQSSERATTLSEKGIFLLPVPE